MIDAKILVADDDPSFRKLIEGFLARDGAAVITAGSGLETLSAFEAEKPDLVLLDVVMPEGDGFETCCRLRAQSLVPIIMLSALNRNDYVVKAFECGADDFIAKPLHLIVLQARIGAALRRSHLSRTASR